MIAEDKANQLVAKYIFYVEAFSSNQQEENAKQCALIAVDELINENSQIEEMVGQGFNLEYWQEVKSKIISL